MFQISIQLKNVVVDLLHQYFLDNNEGIYVPHKPITTPSPNKRNHGIDSRNQG